MAPQTLFIDLISSSNRERYIGCFYLPHHSDGMIFWIQQHVHKLLVGFISTCVVSYHTMQQSATGTQKPTNQQHSYIIMRMCMMCNMMGGSTLLFFFRWKLLGWILNVFIHERHHIIHIHNMGRDFCWWIIALGNKNSHDQAVSVYIVWIDTCCCIEIAGGCHSYRDYSYCVVGIRSSLLLDKLLFCKEGVLCYG